MTAAPSPASLSPATGEIARLAVEIADVMPRVARVVEVPIDIRLDDLHFVLQIAIGWQNGHPFEFRIGDSAWGLPDRDAEETIAPAEQATLADVLARGDTFTYDYVFGEDWQHTVSVLARGPAEPGARYPSLVSAEGRCPPADIGGPVGYETYLRTIADPDEHQPRGHARLRRAGFRSPCGRRRDAAQKFGEPRALYRPQAEPPRPHPSRLAPLAPQDDENRQ